MKLFLTLSFVATAQLLRIDSAFAAAEAEKELLKRTAAQAETIAAFKELEKAANNIAADNAVADTSALKPDVVAYYNDMFEKEYEKKNGGAKLASLSDHIGGLTPVQIAAQYYYIAKNPNPLGSKHLMDKSDDKSSYSQIHSKHHPVYRKLLDENGLYDIFMANQQGLTFYTVFKELDFMNNHVAGPNAKSGLGEAIQEALKGKCGEVVESRVDKYNFSYDVLALFIGAPVCDGANIIGAMAFQVNP